MNLPSKNYNHKNQARKKQRIKFIIASCLVSVVALVFIVTNFRSNIVFFYSPAEISTQEVLNKIKNKKIIRVGGLVKVGSVKNLENNILEFTLTDLKDELIVHYSGIKPDLFREKQGMVAKGFLDTKRNIFIASELLTKHDEKYMPPEVAKAVEKNTYYEK